MQWIEISGYKTVSTQNETQYTLRCEQLFFIDFANDSQFIRIHISYTHEWSMMVKVRNVMIRCLVVDVSTDVRVDHRTVSHRWRDQTAVEIVLTRLVSRLNVSLVDTMKSCLRVQYEQPIIKSPQRVRLVVTFCLKRKSKTSAFKL